MFQKLSLSDLQPGVYSSHFASGKEQIFIEMFFLIQNTPEREKKKKKDGKIQVLDN